MPLFKKIWVFPLLFLIITGCRKPTSANWDVDVVLPVVNSTLNIKNFIGDSIFTTDNTGLLSLSINRQVAAIKLDSLLNLPETNIVQTFTAPISSVFQPQQPFTTLPPTELEFQLASDIKIRKADIRTGVITVKFSNNVTQPVDLVYNISSAVKNGQPLRIAETVPTGVNSLIKSYDLLGYSLNMRGLSGNVYNTIVQTYTVGLSPTASSVLVTSGQGATIEVQYSKIVPDYVEGYFGQQTIKLGADTATKIDFANNITAGNFMLSEATFDVNIKNEFGAEFSANLSNIKSVNSRQNHTVTLATGQLSDVHIDAATKTGNIIQPKTKAVNINTANSNVTSFVSNLPDQINYNGSVVLNPLGNVSDYNNFAFYNTGITVDAIINIPMRFTASYFRLQSKTAVDFSTTTQLDHVNTGNFVILASNGYPFEARLQAFLLDENGSTLDSLFTGTVFSNAANVIQHGQLDSQNKVIAATGSRLLVPINKNKIAKLKKTKSIQVVSYFILPPNPPEIKLYENYQFDINIIAELNYNVDLGSN